MIDNLHASFIFRQSEGLITDLTQETTNYYLCLFVSCRYNDSVNFTEGRCPGSKAMVFDNFITVPNVSIGDCGYTIAFWIRLSGKYDGVVISGSSRSGKTFSLLIDGYSPVFDFCYETFTRILLETGTCVNGSSDVVMNNWTHIAVTCEQENRVKIFFNGEIANITEENTFGFLLFITKPPKETFVISAFSHAVIMDLHILGFALPGDEIYDLYRG